MDGIVFKPFRKYLTILGIEPKNWGKIILIVLCGVMLFFALGTLMVNTEDVVAPSEQNAQKTSLQEELRVLKAVDSKVDFALSSVNSPSAEDVKEATTKVVSNLSTSQQEAYELATEHQLSTSMTDDDLDSYVVKTKIVQIEAISPAVRAIVCIIFPAVFGIGWYLDLRGFSLSTEARRFNLFRKRKPMFVSKRRAYISQ